MASPQEHLCYNSLCKVLDLDVPTSLLHQDPVLVHLKWRGRAWTLPIPMGSMGRQSPFWKAISSLMSRIVRFLWPRRRSPGSQSCLEGKGDLSGSTCSESCPIDRCYRVTLPSEENCPGENALPMQLGRIFPRTPESGVLIEGGRSQSGQYNYRCRHDGAATRVQVRESVFASRERLSLARSPAAEGWQQMCISMCWTPERAATPCPFRSAASWAWYLGPGLSSCVA